MHRGLYFVTWRCVRGEPHSTPIDCLRVLGADAEDADKLPVTVNTGTQPKQQ